MAETTVTDPTTFADFGKEMWSYLTGRDAAINYEFQQMTIEVPKSTGPDSPRAAWLLDGTLRITTSDRESS
ncbi:hypothetical protein [Euzebya tangerina]|uniref:hypothetical protein n=1 Tax=Euzebya tangerina TaxID=591198 RepID=UPI000E31DFD7|nr:hypothetical protein [Euzebya tangerina]